MTLELPFDEFRVLYKGRTFLFPKGTLRVCNGYPCIKERYTHPFLMRENKPNQIISMGLTRKIPDEMLLLRTRRVLPDCTGPYHCKSLDDSCFEKYVVHE